MNSLEDELRYYKEESARYALRVAELKSTWSYRIVAPIRLVERAINSIRKRYFRQSKQWGAVKPRNGRSGYRKWIKEFDTLSSRDIAVITSNISQLHYKPRISIIVMPGANSAKKTWASLGAQLYRDFEILAGAPPPSSPDLENVSARHIEWNSGMPPVEFFNAALAEATGEYCLAIEAGDLLSPYALYLYADAINEWLSANLIYSDEDDLTRLGTRARPFFKPGWDAQLALSFDYVGRTALYRTQRLRELKGALPAASHAWRWDLLLRIMEGENARIEAVRIPFVLLHRHRASTAVRPLELQAGRRVVSEALARQKLPAAITVDARGWLSVVPALPEPLPHVSIIIATRDRVDLLKKCVNGILNRTTYPKFDLTIVDNLSEEKKTLDYLESLKSDPRVTIVSYPEPFNFAALHNVVIPKTRGDLIALLNNDVDVIRADWLERMAGFAVRPDVGIVGAKLYYPNDTIQHAGVALNVNGPAVHIYQGYARLDTGPRGLLMVSRDVTAVTAACTVIRRSVFEECGGFDEKFAVDYNDIDLCMRARANGYRVALVADAELYHFESATRGASPQSVQKLVRQNREIEEFCRCWLTNVLDDHFFNPNMAYNFSRNGLAFPPRTQRPWRGRFGRETKRTAAARSSPLIRGVAVYGMFHAEIGLGQAARGIAGALRTTTIPFSCHLTPYVTHLANSVAFPCSEGKNSNYDTALLMINACDVIEVHRHGPLPIEGKHRIGFWHWELPVFPAIWAEAIELVDEIWVPSRFVAGSLACSTTKPVRIIPHAVSGATVDKADARRQFDLPQDAFVFLTTFDASSYVTRKNPKAVIRAFLDAFPQHGPDGPLLVVKFHHAPGDESSVSHLRQLMSEHKRIIPMGRVFAASEMAALTCAADAFVSLHRSEGFGLNIAEAMAAGRLAIATNFSGNTDFMNAKNSVPIPYRMQALEPNEYLYGTGQWWADPDHEAAVEALRSAVKDSATGARLANRARHDIATQLSPAAVGRIVQATLGQGGY